MRERSIKIIEFLKEFTRLRSVVKRDIGDFEDHLWFNEVPMQTGCYSRTWGSSDDHPADLWLQVSKQPEPKMPPPAAAIAEWADQETLLDSSSLPTLRDHIVTQRAPLPSDIEPPPPEKLSLDAFPEIQRLWDSYVAEQWKPWAELHRRWKEVHGVYSKLFSIHQTQIKLGEEFELVVGIGCLVWKTPRNQLIRRHLIVSRAVLQFDASRGVFSLFAPAEGAKLQLELEMLEADEAPSSQEKKQIDDLLSQCENDPWDRSTVEPVLKSIANSIDNSGVYETALVAAVRSEPRPHVTFAPALVLRKRSGDDYRRLLTKIQNQLESGGVIPGGLARIAGAAAASGAETGDPASPANAGEVYFPLAANEDQLQIVHKLRGQSGIHVQGPPGTGKSHTIANLICHLLATGKRLLITAQTPRALKVLHEKIPKDIQPLCVSLLGNDKASFDHLERCVREVVGRFDSWKRSEYEGRIHTAEHELHELRSRLSTAKSKLRMLRERETFEHEVAGGKYRGTAASIASQLNSESVSFNWLRDDVNPEREPPVCNAEALELLTTHRSLLQVHSDDLDLQVVPAASAQKLLDLLEPLFVAEKDADLQLRVHSTCGNAEEATKAASLPANLLSELTSAIDDFDRLLLPTLSRPQGWVIQAVRDVLGSNDAHWRSLFEAAGSSIAELVAAVKKRETVRLLLPETHDRIRVCADAEDLRNHLDAGGSIGLMALFNPVVKRTKYLQTSVTIDGRAANSSATLQVLIDSLKAERAVDDAWRLWSEHADRPTGSLLKQAAVLSEHTESLHAVLELLKLQSAARARLSHAPALGEPTWHDSDSVRAFAASLRLAEALRRRKEAQESIEKLIAPLRAAACKPGVHALLEKLLNGLVARDRSAARRCVDEVKRIEKVRAVRRRRDELASRMECEAPETVQALLADPSEVEWDIRLQQFENAWHHARASAWLKATFGEADEQACEEEIHHLNNRIGQTTARLAADLAWMQCLSRMSDDHRRHFVAWSQAMKNLGKGTGKYAEKHRLDAQRNLAKCRDAIPAWIMPLHHVYESVEPSPELFDIVIVDEASQCGLDSRVLAYLTKQLVVVGDDKQISPEAIGTDRGEVFGLIQEHLGNLPHSESFQPERSLFDFADLWFGDRIVLREHFRCVPEIIRFSSDLCYQQKPLIPLRQYPPDRLKPLVPRRIAGFRQGKGSSVENRAEAEALVKAVVSCCKDVRYQGKTFGIISLQGDAQAKLIEKLLLDAIEPREIEARKIVCGNAYSFQGDERHVMFLSMVAAPNEQIGVLSKEADVRRFNVAASRAQDQVWLFHSVDASDLSVECCRRRLLNYFYQPREQTFRGLPVDSWRQKALAKSRSMGQQPHPFESWFELDVFLRFLDKGYRVIPQFEVAASRIDLMVEGLRARLAVECNGEHWHGPDRWEHDQDRQRRLERAGLQFFTVWESAFRRDPEQTLEPVWHQLEQMNIRPLGTGESVLLDMDGYVPQSQPEAAVAVDEKVNVLSATEQLEIPSHFRHDPTSPKQPRTDQASAVGSGPTTTQETTTPTGTAVPTNDEPFSLAEHLVAQPQQLSSLEEYAAWQPYALPDPRTADVMELIDGLNAIIASEGNVLCLRAYQQFARAAGVMKLHSPTRSRFNQAIQRGVESGQFVLSDGYGSQYQMNRFVRLKGTPLVRLRTLGPRTIHEVPPEELGAMINLMMIQVRPATRKQLFRAVLDAYGLVRATEQALSTLEEAMKWARPSIDLP